MTNIDALYSNAAIISNAAKKMLTADRIRQMLTASSLTSAAQILTECGYNPVSGTDDEIIETERAKTYEMFMSLCNDAALAACVTAWHQFKTKQTTPGTSYIQAEKQLFETIAGNSPAIKEPNIKSYFTAQLDAFNKGQKIPNSRLFKLTLDGRHDLETMGPLFHWYILKQSEFRAVKIILMGKRFGFTREQITENLRGLHERF